jgi:hypothetical protein
MRNSVEPRSIMATSDRFDIEAVLDDLYRNDISGSITWVSDAGFFATLGSPIFAKKRCAGSILEAVEWLRHPAIAYYPESDFPQKRAG